MSDNANRAERSRFTQSLQLIILALLVAVIVTVIYAPVLDAQARSFDDEEAISANVLVQHPSWQSVGRFFGEITRSSVIKGYYRPLTLTSLMLDWAMGGRPNDLYVFHRTSLALHVGCTVLIVLLCYQIFGRVFVAAMVGLLFGLHPLTAEPVAWVMERKTLLAAIFAFGCLNTYVRYTQVGGKRWYVAAVLLYMISLLAKPTGTPLPVMMLLMDYWPLKRLKRRAILEKIPFAILAALFALLCVVCEQKVNPLSIPAKLSAWHLPLRLCWLVAFYPYKILLPMNLTSSYAMPDPLTLGNPVIALSVAVVAVALVVLIIFRRWTTALWVSAVIFYVGLSPTMGFVGYSWVVASDKYVYLPSIALIFLLGWLLGWCWGPSLMSPRFRLRRLGITTLIFLLVVAESIATRNHLQHWRDTETLLRYMLQLTPKSYRLHYNMGAALIEKGENEQAKQHYLKALELQPKYYKALNNLGTVLVNEGKTAEAIDCYEKSLQIEPNFAEAHSNLGTIYLQLRQVATAIQHYQQAVRLEPNLPDALNNLAWALATHEMANPPDSAYPVKLAERACQLNYYKMPDHLDTLAACYASANRFDEAVRTAQKAIGLAEASDQRPLADVIRQRLRLYEMKQAFREPNP